MKTAYLYPPASNGWKKQCEPVLGSKKEIYFDPFVRKMNDEFVMVVSYRNENTIRISFSHDGISWSKPKDILQGRQGRWDEIVNRASCLKVKGIYYVWYTGQSNGKSAIGLALSTDGRILERYCDDALIIAEHDCEGVSVMNPCVLWDETENLFKMWYAAGENYEPDVICYATSHDGVKWKKYGGNPVLTKGTEKYDCAKVGGCDVVRYGDTYHMFYIGYENVDNARICHAVSGDGMNWKRTEDNPVLSPSRELWDKHAVYKPTVCIESDRIYLWYNGRANRKEMIGLAIKERTESEREDI